MGQQQGYLSGVDAALEAQDRHRGGAKGWLDNISGCIAAFSIFVVDNKPDGIETGGYARKLAKLQLKSTTSLHLDCFESVRSIALAEDSSFRLRLSDAVMLTSSSVTFETRDSARETLLKQRELSNLRSLD